MTGHRKWSDIRNRALDKPVHRAAQTELASATEVALALGKLRDEREAAREQGAQGPTGATLSTTCLTHHEGEYLAALRGYVEDLGGTLEIVAVFPDQRILLVPATDAEDGAGAAGTRTDPQR